ncbi:DNA polymerase III subunit theta [Symbiopectobacterium sp. Eva_TO]
MRWWVKINADFAASTVAFMESQKREICAETIAQKIPPEKRAYFEARLAPPRYTQVRNALYAKG